MGKLTILKLDDGDPFADSMRREIHSFCDSVEVKSLYDFNINDNQDGLVNLVILSSLVCKEINRFPVDTWQRLLVSQVKTTVVLLTCKEEGETVFRELCQRLGALQSELHIYNYQRDKAEWYKAESQLKILLSHGNKLDIPRERSFILKPSTIRQNDTEVVVVLFEDHPDAVSLSANLSCSPGQPSKVRNLKKVRDALWTIDTAGLKSGKYTVQIIVDNKDIGETVLTVRDEIETLVETLEGAMNADPRALLSRLFGLEMDSFDEEMADILQNSAPFLMTKLFDGLTNCGNTEDKERMTFGEFLNKLGCVRTKNVITYSDPKRGQTEKHRSPSSREAIKVPASDSDDEKAPTKSRKQNKLEKTTSPLSTSSKRIQYPYPATLGGSIGRHQNLSDGVMERKHFVLGRGITKGHSFSYKKENTRDSGISTGSSTGNDSRGEVRPYTRRDRIVSEGEVKGYDFHGGRQHPYDTIDEPTHGHILRSTKFNPYDDPWENDPLPQGKMPQKQTDEHFSERL